MFKKIALALTILFTGLAFAACGGMSWVIVPGQPAAQDFTLFESGNWRLRAEVVAEDTVFSQVQYLYNDDYGALETVSIKATGETEYTTVPTKTVATVGEKKFILVSNAGTFFDNLENEYTVSIKFENGHTATIKINLQDIENKLEAQA